MLMVWLLGCLFLSAALPGAVLMRNRLQALAGTLTVAAAWFIMLMVAPDLGMAGALLLFGLWGLSVVATLTALIIRVGDAISR